MNIGWTVNEYSRLCRELVRTGRPLMPINEFFHQQTSDAIALRHDVDRFPENALCIAKLEADMGIRSTYYVRVSRSGPDPTFIRRLIEKGHEIGYHYEVLAKANGDRNAALELFSHELDYLRSISSVVTASPHGSPFSRWDSLQLWDTSSIQRFGIIGDAYLDIDFQHTLYLTDTGRTWKDTKSNLRDRPHEANDFDRLVEHIQTTEELIKTLPNLRGIPLCLQTHPERWNATLSGFMRSFILDIGANTAKRIIRATHPLSVRGAE